MAGPTNTSATYTHTLTAPGTIAGTAAVTLDPEQGARIIAFLRGRERASVVHYHRFAFARLALFAVTKPRANWNTHAGQDQLASA